MIAVADSWNRTGVLGVDRLAACTRWNHGFGAARVSCVTHRGARRCVLAGVLGSALLNCAAAADSHTQTRIGRLFSSPAQRIELNRLRNEFDDEMDAAPAPGRIGDEYRSEPQHGFSSLALTFNGVVVRSDGHRVAWIDGVETGEGQTTPAGVRIDAIHTPGGRLRIRLPRARSSVVLEPGQFVDNGGRTRKAYERRSNRIDDGLLHERTADSHGAAGPGHSAATAESRKSVSPEAPSTDFVPGLLRETRTGSGPLHPRARDGKPAGGGSAEAYDSIRRNTEK